MKLLIFFLASSDFNGLSLRSSAVEPKHLEYIEAIKELVRQGRISCVFASVSLNPHIKRLPDLPIDEQLNRLSNLSSDSVCLYPSSDLVRENFDVTKFDDRPFSKMLLLSAPQLEWLGFDLGVFDRYYNDPRYHFRFLDHGGHLSIRDDVENDSGLGERDRIFLQTFGVGYDEDDRRVAVVFFRYLSDLSPEHQQYWKTFLCEGKIKLHREYYRASFSGEFPEYGSYFAAIVTEIGLINEITKAAFSTALFRAEPGEDRPVSLTLFFRPTLRNFNDFILALDKLLSENISYDFFRGRFSFENEEERSDGKIVIHKKGSLALLEEWMRSDIRWDDVEEAVSVIVDPLRRVRKLRMSPAHKIEENKFSKEYDEQQHVIVRDVYVSLRHLRMTLAGHPQAPSIRIPQWIEEGKIAFA